MDIQINDLIINHDPAKEWSNLVEFFTGSMRLILPFLIWIFSVTVPSKVPQCVPIANESSI
jgi:hypothetical protein